MHKDEITTQATLPTARKIITRQNKRGSTSRDHSSKSSRNKSLSSQFSTPFIRMNFFRPQQTVSAFQLNSSELIPKSVSNSNLSYQSSQRNLIVNNQGSKQKQLTKKIQELVQQIYSRQQQLNQASVQKQNLMIQVTSLKTKVKLFQESNSILRKSQFDLKNTLNKMNKQVSVLTKQKQQLLKKISQLQNDAFLPKPINFQNMREIYLQKQLMEIRHKMNNQKSNTQKQLQQQIQQLRQKLFNANRLIQNLRINNLCLHQKNQTISIELKNRPQLLGLKTKYKKTLDQRNQLKKSRQMSSKQISHLVKQNCLLSKQIEKLKQLSLCESGLSYSMTSILSQQQ